MDSDLEVEATRSTAERSAPYLLGILKGEGIGAEVIAAALRVGAAAASRFNFEWQIETGGVIGLEAKRRHALELSPDVIDFCSEIFAAQGAILSGPGGGHYVHDLRRRFRLFYKVNPILSFPELAGVSRLKTKPGAPVDILLVRENVEGLYQGETREIPKGKSHDLAHTLFCTEENVRPLLEQACRLAKDRSQHVTVIVKRGALEKISSLWKRCAEEVMTARGIRFELMDVDFAAYQLVHAPEAFDVVACPNCFGDILADLGGLFFGSRGLTYGASYAAEGHGVYQTNHGCAYDLAGTNRANPVGQIFSLAMLLRESCHLPDAADAIIHAVRSVWAAGWRTADLMERGCRLVGTEVLAEKISEAILSDERPVP